ncbi:MAG: site-specific integrase [Acidobacteria bacterium]|nr:site-specific integrase [Acidobacteriota bacterium]
MSPRRAPRPRVAFTKPRVAELQPEAERYYVYDQAQRRLAVLVMPSGAKSWYLVKKSRGRLERLRLGTVDDLSPELARKRAGILAGQVDMGRSPTAERRAIRAEMTLAALWTEFKKRHGPRKRSLSTDETRYAKHLAAWGSRKLSSIDRPAVIRLLDTITSHSGPGAANRVRALLHTLFEKAREWGADLHNPVAGTPRNREQSKARYLSADELRRFLDACEAEHDDEARDFLRLLLFTGARRGSLAAARWRDVSLKDALWRIPAESMKAGRPLEVPLAPAAVAILREREQHAAPGAVWIFPAPGTTSGHTNGPRAGWVRVLTSAKLAEVTQHDLRRTFATYALEAGVPLPHIAAVLGHTPVGGVTAVYARPTPAQVKAGVVRAVEYLVAVAHGSAEVIPFRPAAGQP